MKKGKKIRYKRRVLIYSALIFLILFSIIDYYFETYGLPQFVELEVKSQLKRRGFDFDFASLKCGIINGVVLTEPILKDPQYSNNILFSAKKMEISLKPSFSGKYFIALDAFEIDSGLLSIPFFPESGLEGESDIIRIEDFNAKIGLTVKGLEIKYFTGKLSPFKFSAAGSLNNILFPLVMASDYSNLNKKKSSSFSAIPAIKSIPYSTRSNIYRKFLQIKEDRVFKGTPELRFVFNIDTLTPHANTMKADMKLPSFEYAGFAIKQVDTRISYERQKLILNAMKIQLFDIGEINLDGTLDSDTSLITGNIKGTLSPAEVEAIFKLLKFKLPPAMQFSKKVSFQMELKNFSVDSIQSQGTLKVKIPEATFKGVKMFDIQTDLHFRDNAISGSELSFSTARNEVSGDFLYNIPCKSIDATIQFSGPPLFIAKIMEDEDQNMMNQILKRFTFPKDDKNIEIFADVHCSWEKEFFYYISGNMVMHSFKYLDTELKSGDARVIIDSNEILIIPMMTLIQKDALATIAMAYDDSVEMQYHVDSPEFQSKYKSNNRFLSEIQSSLPGNDVLNCIFPDWESKTLDMSDKVNMKARGIIDFSEGNPDTDLTDFKVSIFDSSCKWYSLPIEKLKCDLIFKKMDMEIKNVDGKVYNGDLSLYYKTNFNTNKGKINVTLKDTDFAPVAQHVNWDLEGDKGKISVITNSDFEYDEKDKLLMTGKGNVKIRDANLWEVPIIKTFGKLTSQWIGDRWGVISELDADFDFKKDHLYSDNIQTNGNVVALRSDGSYFWDTGNFDFLIHAEILKSVKILSKILDPITGLLENRVKRTNGEIKWESEKIFKKDN